MRKLMFERAACIVIVSNKLAGFHNSIFACSDRPFSIFQKIPDTRRKNYPREWEYHNIDQMSAPDLYQGIVCSFQCYCTSHKQENWPSFRLCANSMVNPPPPQGLSAILPSLPVYAVYNRCSIHSLLKSVLQINCRMSSSVFLVLISFFLHYR